MAENCRKLKFSEDVMCLAADCREDLIVSGYEEGHVRVWDPRCEDTSAVLSGRCRKNDVDQQYDDVVSLSFGRKQSEEIHVAAGRHIFRLDLRKMESSSWTNPIFAQNEDDINHISLSDDDQTLAAADDSHTVTIMDLKHLRLLARMKKHKNVVYSVEFRPGKPRELISGGYDCAIVHWDVFKCRTLGTFDLGSYVDPEWDLPKAFNPSYVLCCRFAALNCDPGKANAVFAGTENGNLHCFKCDKSLKHVRTFRAHDLGVTQLTLGPGEQGAINIVHTGSNDGKIKQWNATELFAEGELQLSKPEAVQIMDHGEKINWLGVFQNRELVICDTSADITLLPLIG